MDLNISQMKELIDLFENSDLTEMSVEHDDYQVTLKKNSAGKPDPEGSGSEQVRVGGTERKGVEGPGKGQAGGTGAEGPAEDEDFITSPIVGTFYRSPSPEEPPYVEVGDMVEEGETVCIVEAMKVMNEVRAEKGGEIAEICVQDGDPVEYGQELFRLESGEEGS